MPAWRAGLTPGGLWHGVVARRRERSMGKKRKRLNLDRIADSLLEVQKNFDEINNQLTMRREYPSDGLIQNLLNAYNYLDDLVGDKVKLLPDNAHHMLELNHIVLCGRDPLVRHEFASHLQETENRFLRQIKLIKKWHKKNKKESVYKVAAQIYVSILSQPQLFVEGNHRTGSLVASYFLLMKGKDPFVLNINNAVAYFEPSTQIKFRNKETIKGRLRLPKYRSRFRKFLKEQVQADKKFFVLN